ncbi:glycosyltransferase family 2 protein [Olegusella massiliensis]|uniref:glycosyltransferase family 2 protein n=1 Tax=Olegusella massiliensis TaxID=1776381 RepID=UPI0023F69047|nr:glycosyltransferase family 2 protein [Olegusella massiliensis]
MLSVVIPAFDEGQLIYHSAEVTSSILVKAHIPFELVFVDDGSRDNTWLEIERACAIKGVRGIGFSRNFGKEGAIFAGLEAAKGDVVAVMDCDLQHPPLKLVEMYHLWEEGYEVIEGVKDDRGEESAFHAWAANLFYKMMGNATGIDMAGASDFKMLDRRAVESLLQLPERRTFFRALSAWIGYKTTQVHYEVAERELGESKWTFCKLMSYAIDNVTSFTAAPLQFVTGLGAVLMLIFLVVGIQTLVRWILGNAVAGFTTVILLLLLIGGAIMIALGIIGFYLSRMYDELKGRPRYIVARSAGMTTNNEASGE